MLQNLEEHILATCTTHYLGLAPFLRLSIAGADVQAVARAMLAQAEHDQNNANLWLNLSTVMLCLEQRAVGLAMQQQALALTRTFRIDAAVQPPCLRLLLLAEPGDLAANTPLDCLLEHSDTEINLYYLTPGLPLPPDLPAHDVLLLGLGVSDTNGALLAYLQQALAHWPKPVLNRPEHIPNTERSRASELLQGIPGLLVPPTLRAERAALLALQLPDSDFPLIVRPFGSQGGHGLARVEGPQELADYLARHTDAPGYYVSPFIDYADDAGFFRKMRIALIDGQPYACHMAVSSHWMVHYLNAGMYDEAWKRAQELAFMEQFDQFVARHSPALATIAQRIGLDYVCMDCAQTLDGQLLLFEVDHVMVVHAMDAPDKFPYKQEHMQKVKAALCALLQKVAAP